MSLSLSLSLSVIVSLSLAVSLCLFLSLSLSLSPFLLPPSSFLNREPSFAQLKNIRVTDSDRER